MSASWRIGAAATFAAINLAAYAYPAWAETRAFDLPSMPANQALQLFARQAGLQIIAPSDALVGIRTREIHGQYDPRVALRRLLADTRLEIASDTGSVISLRMKPRPPAPPPAPTPPRSVKHDKPRRPAEASASDIASTALEEVIVTAAAPAGALKRDSDTVVDSVTELEISRLPNLDVSDALTRLPGVHRDETQSGENRYVQIRGLDNAAASQSIDGVLLTNYVGSSRAASTEALSAQFIKNIIVTPTVTPDLDENSNSANVAITTVSGLDNAGTHLFDVTGFAGSASRGGGVQSTNFPVRGSLLWKGALGAAQNIGLAVGFSVDQLGSRQDATSVSGFSAVDGSFVPSGALTRGATFANTDRFAGFVRLDAQVTPQLRLFGEYFRLVHDYKTDQYTSAAAVSSAGVQEVSGATGQFSSAGASYAYDGGGLDIRDHIAILGGDYDMGGHGHLSFRGNLTLNTTVSTSYGTSGFSAAAASLAAPIQYTATKDTLSLTPGVATSLSDPANYLLNGDVVLSDMVTNDRNYFLRGDYAFNSALKDRGLGFKAGVQYKTLSRESEQRGGAVEAAPGQVIRLSEATQASSVSLFDPIAINGNALLKLLAERGVPVPDANGLYASDPANGFGQDFQASEQVGVGYFVASYAARRWRLSAGFRYAYTNRRLLDYEPDDAGVWRQDRYGQHYGNLLPSVYGSYAVASSLKLRGAFTETLERPALSSASRNVLASYTTPPTITISYSSPYLLPTRSRNVDVSLDYYYGRHDAYVSAGAFSKYLTDIPGVSSATTVDSNGDIVVTSYRTNLTSVNGKSVYGTDDGLEFIWSDPHIFLLPDRLGRVGAFMSYDYIVYKTPALNGGAGVPSTDLILVDSAPRSYFNGEIFYNYGPVVVNLSYEAQSSVPSLAYNSAADQRTTYGGLLDAQASCALTPHLRFVVEGRNLTDQDIVTRYGLTGYERVNQIRNDGRTIWMGGELTF